MTYGMEIHMEYGISSYGIHSIFNGISYGIHFHMEWKVCLEILCVSLYKIQAMYFTVRVGRWEE